MIACRAFGSFLSILAAASVKSSPPKIFCFGSLPYRIQSSFISKILQISEMVLSEGFFLPDSTCAIKFCDSVSLLANSVCVNPDSFLIFFILSFICHHLQKVIYQKNIPKSIKKSWHNISEGLLCIYKAIGRRKK